MALPTPEYPGATWDGNEQNEANDDPGNTAIANAADHNEAAAEVVAVEDDLRAGLALTDDADMEAFMGRVVAEYDDGAVYLNARAIPDDGASFASVGANGNLIQRRPGNAGNTHTYIPFDLAIRENSAVGRKITGYSFVYSVTSAPVDDVELRLYTVAKPVHDVAMAAPSLVPVTWDADHDSAAERGADDGGGGIKYHTAVCTLDSPAYGVAGQGCYLDWYTDGDAGATGVVDVYAVWVHYDLILFKGA